MTRLRAVLALTFVALVALLFTFGLAHADPVAPAGAAPGFDLSTWIMLGLAALAGVRVIVDALLAFFKAEAPLTKSTVDDKIRDDLQLVHDKLDRVAAGVNGLVALAKPPGGIRVIPGTGTAAMLVVVLLAVAGSGIAMGSGCTAAERSAVATNAKAGLVNCTATAIGATPALDLGTLAAVVNLTAAERAKCMTPTGLSWACVETDAIAKGVTLGGCMFVDMVAAAAKAIQPSASGLAANPAPPPGRAELEDYRGKVGGAIWHTAAGDQ